jgi:amino acid permease
MKKTIIISIAIFICAIILYFIYAILGKLDVVKENKRKESVLPQICLNSINNEYFCLYDLLNKPILVIYFGTDCSYCELLK